MEINMATKSKKSTKTASKKNIKKTLPKVNTKTPVVSKSLTKKNQAQTFSLLVAALVFMVLAMGYMRFKYLLIPATVNGSPIFSWSYVKSLHQTAGTQVIDQLVVEKLISQEAKDLKIEISQEELDAEYARLELQFESVGGLDAFLASQGLKKKDIDDQVKLNLQVQKIVADSVALTDEEVDEYYQANINTFEGLTPEEAKEQAAKILYDQTLQQQISVWVQDLRAKGQVTINFPSAQVQ
jgi:foldase protein PrsA